MVLIINTVEFGFNVMEVTEYSVYVQTSVVLTDDCIVTVNSGEVFAITGYPTQ
jgi:hypothetical protein